MAAAECKKRGIWSGLRIVSPSSAAGGGAGASAASGSHRFLQGYREGDLGEELEQQLETVTLNVNAEHPIERLIFLVEQEMRFPENANVKADLAKQVAALYLQTRKRKHDAAAKLKNRVLEVLNAGGNEIADIKIFIEDKFQRAIEIAENVGLSNPFTENDYALFLKSIGNIEKAEDMFLNAILCSTSEKIKAFILSPKVNDILQFSHESSPLVSEMDEFNGDNTSSLLLSSQTITPSSSEATSPNRGDEDSPILPKYNAIIRLYDNDTSSLNSSTYSKSPESIAARIAELKMENLTMKERCKKKKDWVINILLPLRFKNKIHLDPVCFKAVKNLALLLLFRANSEEKDKKAKNISITEISQDKKNAKSLLNILATVLDENDATAAYNYGRILKDIATVYADRNNSKDMWLKAAAKREKARQMFHSSITRDVEYASGYIELGKMYWEDYVGACTGFNNLSSCKKSSTEIDLIYAKIMLDQAISCYPNDPESNYYLGMIHSQPLYKDDIKANACFLKAIIYGEKREDLAKNLNEKKMELDIKIKGEMSFAFKELVKLRDSYDAEENNSKYLLLGSEPMQHVFCSLGHPMFHTKMKRISSIPLTFNCDFCYRSISNIRINGSLFCEVCDKDICVDCYSKPSNDSVDKGADAVTGIKGHIEPPQSAIKNNHIFKKSRILIAYNPSKSVTSAYMCTWSISDSKHVCDERNIQPGGIPVGFKSLHDILIEAKKNCSLPYLSGLPIHYVNSIMRRIFSALAGLYIKYPHLNKLSTLLLSTIFVKEGSDDVIFLKNVPDYATEESILYLYPKMPLFTKKVDQYGEKDETICNGKLVDTWSLGCIWLSLLTGELPWVFANDDHFSIVALQIKLTSDLPFNFSMINFAPELIQFIEKYLLFPESKYIMHYSIVQKGMHGKSMTFLQLVNSTLDRMKVSIDKDDILMRCFSDGGVSNTSTNPNPCERHHPPVFISKTPESSLALIQYFYNSIRYKRLEEYTLAAQWFIVGNSFEDELQSKEISLKVYLQNKEDSKLTISRNSCFKNGFNSIRSLMNSNGLHSYNDIRSGFIKVAPYLLAQEVKEEDVEKVSWISETYTFYVLDQDDLTNIECFVCQSSDDRKAISGLNISDDDFAFEIQVRVMRRPETTMKTESKLKSLQIFKDQSQSSPLSRMSIWLIIGAMLKEMTLKHCADKLVRSFNLDAIYCSFDPWNQDIKDKSSLLKILQKATDEFKFELPLCGLLRSSSFESLYFAEEHCEDYQSKVKKYNEKTDMYLFGVFILELILGENTNNDRWFIDLEHGFYFDLGEEYYGSPIEKIVRLCTHKDPSNRFGAADLLNKVYELSADSKSFAFLSNAIIPIPTPPLSDASTVASVIPPDSLCDASRFYRIKYTFKAKDEFFKMVPDEQDKIQEYWVEHRKVALQKIDEDYFKVKITKRDIIPWLVEQSDDKKMIVFPEGLSDIIFIASIFDIMLQDSWQINVDEENGRITFSSKVASSKFQVRFFFAKEKIENPLNTIIDLMKLQNPMLTKEPINRLLNNVVSLHINDGDLKEAVGLFGCVTGKGNKYNSKEKVVINERTVMKTENYFNDDGKTYKHVLRWGRAIENYLWPFKGPLAVLIDQPEEAYHQTLLAFLKVSKELQSKEAWYYTPSSKKSEHKETEDNFIFHVWSCFINEFDIEGKPAPFCHENKGEVKIDKVVMEDLLDVCRFIDEELPFLKGAGKLLGLSEDDAIAINKFVNYSRGYLSRKYPTVDYMEKTSKEGNFKLITDKLLKLLTKMQKVIWNSLLIDSVIERANMFTKWSFPLQSSGAVPSTDGCEGGDGLKCNFRRDIATTLFAQPPCSRQSRLKFSSDLIEEGAELRCSGLLVNLKVSNKLMPLDLKSIKDIKGLRCLNCGEKVELHNLFDFESPSSDKKLSKTTFASTYSVFANYAWDSHPCMNVMHGEKCLGEKEAKGIAEIIRYHKSHLQFLDLTIDKSSSIECNLCKSLLDNLKKCNICRHQIAQNSSCEKCKKLKELMEEVHCSLEDSEKVLKSLQFDELRKLSDVASLAAGTYTAPLSTIPASSISSASKGGWGGGGSAKKADKKGGGESIGIKSESSAKDDVDALRDKIQKLEASSKEQLNKRIRELLDKEDSSKYQIDYEGEVKDPPKWFKSLYPFFMDLFIILNNYSTPAAGAVGGEGDGKKGGAVTKV